MEALGARSFGPPLRRRFFRGIQRIAMHLERFLLKFRCQAIFLLRLFVPDRLSLLPRFVLIDPSMSLLRLLCLRLCAPNVRGNRSRFLGDCLALGRTQFFLRERSRRSYSPRCLKPASTPRPNERASLARNMPTRKRPPKFGLRPMDFFRLFRHANSARAVPRDPARSTVNVVCHEPNGT